MVGVIGHLHMSYIWRLQLFLLILHPARATDRYYSKLGWSPRNTTPPPGAADQYSNPPIEVLGATFTEEANVINPGATSDPITHTHHATFVDSNLMPEIQVRIHLSIQWISDSSYLLFGHPEWGVLTPSLSREKLSWLMRVVWIN